MAGFYGTLFSVEITVLGIIAAAAFVFLQILHSNFSYGHLVTFLRRWSFILYGAVSFITTIITAIGFLFLSLRRHDFFPALYVHSNQFFQTDWVAMFVLLLFFVSIGFGLTVIFSSIKHLNPSSILLLQRKRITNAVVRRFLFKKYGIPPLNTFSIESEIYAGANLMKVADGMIKMRLLDGKLDEESDSDDFFTPEEREEIEHKRVIAKGNIERAEAERMKLQKEVENVPDVFGDLASLLARAIAAGDANVLQKYSVQTLDICINFIEYMHANPPAKESPDEELPVYFGKYAGELLTSQIELCNKNKLPSLAPSFVVTNKEVALALLNKRYDAAVYDLLSYWKKLADDAITSGHRALFNELMISYREVAKSSLELSTKEPVERTSRELPHDEVFRHLGWLAERLLSSRGVEEKPLMHDSEYSNEYDALFNALFGFSHDYSWTYTDSYPLIFFDAVMCFCDKLLAIYVKEENETKREGLKNHLFDCFWAFASFAREATKKGGNGRGVGLAVIRLKTEYEEAVKLGAQAPAEDAIALIVDVAFASAMNPENTDSDLMMGQTAHEYLEDAILTSPYRDKVRAEVFERYIKDHDGDHEKKWTFITSLGRKMGTNFGFMFDPTTGEMYPDDDPRRR